MDIVPYPPPPENKVHVEKLILHKAPDGFSLSFFTAPGFNWKKERWEYKHKRERERKRRSVQQQKGEETKGGGNSFVP